MIRTAILVIPFITLFSSMWLGWVLFKKRKLTKGFLLTILIAVFSYYALETSDDRIYKIFIFVVTGLLCIGTGGLISVAVNGIIGIIKPDSQNLRKKLSSAALIVSLCVMTFGFISAETIKLKKYDVVLNSYGREKKDKKVVMFSDLHLGRLIKKEKLEKIRDRVNALKPHLIIIDGDLFDWGTDYFTVNEMNEISEVLKTFKAPEGVYFISGNHDGGSNPADAEKYIEKAGIKVLRNEEVRIDDSLNLYGVNDDDVYNIKIPEKKDDLPLLIIAHQPVDNKTFKNGDLVISGHTHNGQIFPANFLFRSQWSNIYGMKYLDDYKSIVSSGAGYWGIPFRLFTDSEILEINIEFNDLTVS